MAKKQRSAKAASASKATAPMGLLYVSCKTVGFMSIEPPMHIDGIEYSLGIELNTNPETETIVVRVTIDGSGGVPVEGEDSEKRLLFSIITDNIFQGSNMEESIEVTESDVHLPAWAVATIMSTAIGTTRGVLLTKLSGTVYAADPLPIFGLRDFIPEKEAQSIPVHGI